MREIKFRAWDEKREYMEELAWPFYVIDSETIIDVRCSIASELKRKVMQYTGLKDKNGKEIYEGDIVKEPGMAEIDYSGELYQIEFSEGCFVITRPHAMVETTWEKRRFPEAWEVVGNIHENPELLKGKRH